MGGGRAAQVPDEGVAVDVGHAMVVLSRHHDDKHGTVLSSSGRLALGSMPCTEPGLRPVRVPAVRGDGRPGRAHRAGRAPGRPAGATAGVEPFAGAARAARRLRPAGRGTARRRPRRELREETGLAGRRASGAARHLRRPGPGPAHAGGDRRSSGAGAGPAGPAAGSDAPAARWVPVDELSRTAGARPSTTTASLADGVERARAKLEYTPLGAAFCPPEFTVAELRRVYETVWGTGAGPAQLPPQGHRHAGLPRSDRRHHHAGRRPAGAAVPGRHGRASCTRRCCGPVPEPTGHGAGPKSARPAGNARGSGGAVATSGLSAASRGLPAAGRSPFARMRRARGVLGDAVR